MGERENAPETWDPAELLLYAHEYLDQYRSFRRLAESEASEADAYRSIAVSYLEMSFTCLQDAIVALQARLRSGTDSS
jgi:hypothetical protein